MRKDNIVRLKDFNMEDIKKLIPGKDYLELGTDNIQKSLEQHMATDTNYNCKAGITIVNNEERSYYLNKKDIPIYDNVEDVIKDQFIPWILNSASRLQRGYEWV